MTERIFNLPEIDDSDISWVCNAMRLPPTAFSGETGSDPRATVLKCMSSLDIEACPGSGKTTLLVAKLAILSKKWTDKQRGICVLSHTNAARVEIETRIGSSSSSGAMLRYPHFIGTIHSLVNEFLALPWLKSNGFPIKAVDTEITRTLRWQRIPYKTRMYLERINLSKSCMSYDAADFGGEGRENLRSKSAATATTLVKICKETTMEGYFCYDEMFVWANQLLDDFPEIIPAIRERFPLVFVDEVQDNSELQSSLLHRLFIKGDSPVIRQRFGDSNQAIYRQEEQAATSIDAFPNGEKTDLPTSFRFGQAIADLADPFAPVPQGLVGKGPSQGDRCNTIFLFDDHTVQSVLPTYAQLLISSFTPQQLQKGTFTAIAGVHDSDKVDKLPRSLAHYAPFYSPSLTTTSTVLNSFVDHITLGKIAAKETGNSLMLVIRTAAAILRQATLSGWVTPTKRGNAHRQILELLSVDPSAICAYNDLIDDIVIGGGEISQHVWDNSFKVRISMIVSAICGKAPSTDDPFLVWTASAPSSEKRVSSSNEGNFFLYPTIDPILKIRLGSIHSVKGETHTASLILDTFYHAHHLSELKPWLLGTTKGQGKEKVRMQGRLRLHYVGMTRPAYLLCLAMRRDALTSEDIEKLRLKNWRVTDLCPGVGDALD